MLILVILVVLLELLLDSDAKHFSLFKILIDLIPQI